MPKPVSCPTREDLADFLTGSVSDTVLESIEEHLSECEACLNLADELESGLPQRSPNLSETEDLPAVGLRSEDTPPPEFKELSILEQLGKGGFGVVYKARQKRALNRIVAVKVLHNTGAVMRNRIRQEIDALARVKHENIAQIYDTSTAADGTIGIVMEYVEGRSLAEVAVDSSIGISERLRIAEKLCETLHYIHQQRFFHRDITPHNILIAQRDGVLIPKVIDFGLAAFSSQIHLRVTRGAGTAEFMAPEQSGHLEDEISEQTDIYALGLCVYELLTGERAFPSERGETRKAYLDRKFGQTHKLPSLDGAPGLRKELGGLRTRELDQVLEKATQISLSERYETAEAFRKDLAAVVSNRPISLRDRDVKFRSRLFFRRNRSWILGASAALMLLGVSLLAWFGSSERGDRAVNGWGKSLGDMVNRFNPTVTPAPDFASVEQAIDTAETISKEAEGNEFRTTDELLKSRVFAANVFQEMGASPKAIPKLERVVEDLKERFDETNDDVITAEIHLARAYMNASRNDEAKKLFREAAQKWKEKYSAWHEGAIYSLVALAEMNLKTKHYVDAEEVVTQLIEQAHKNGPPSSWLSGAMNHVLGKAKFGLKKYQESVTALELSQSSFEEHGFGVKDPGLMRVQNDLALAYARNKQFESAETLINDVVANYWDVFADGALETDKVIVNQSVILFLCGKQDEGIEIMEWMVENSKSLSMRFLAHREVTEMKRLRDAGEEPR
ncbi:MAG: serine/threonine-protein kinase [Planctomycetota bacterium]